jgi:superfamily II DNA or RNA helicase
MQELQPSLAPGREVAARDRTWTLESIEQGEDCAAVDLVGLDEEGAGIRETLLIPFDEVSAVPPAAAGTHLPIREGPALATLRLLAAEALPWPAPGSAVAARIALMPYQLTACLALASGRARRVLVADPPGSGKTIQAGIAIAHTVERVPGARVLVVVPAGLRSQWAGELRGRFGLEPVEIDGDTNAATAPVGLDDNPWARSGVSLTSIDYLKRPEVLAALDALTWDLLVVDEAHHARPGTDRGDAVEAVARRSLAVLLLTATPHDGDETRFEALCRIGALESDPPVLLLRRHDMGAAGRRRRRSHVLLVQPAAEEQHARRLLEAYTASLHRASGGDSGSAGPLLAAVFEKRAASSPMALTRTARRRAELIGSPIDPSQATLPFGAAQADEDEDDDSAVLARAGPLDPRRERAWLGAVAEAATKAARASAKLRALCRLLRRVREPVIVFTEYRDTLTWLHRELRSHGPLGHLHGAQTQVEREAQLTAFLRGRVRVLLTTDTAAEGLNLQRACRSVVQFDVPWTPMRAEQRVGRVDRLGQQRVVHAWSLITADAIDCRLERHVAARRLRIEHRWERDAADLPPSPMPDAHSDAQVCAALTTARRLSSRIPTRLAPRQAAAGRTAMPRLATLSSRRAVRFNLGAADVLAIVEVAFVEGGARRLETSLVAVRGVSARGLPVATLVRAIGIRAREIARAHAEARAVPLAEAVSRARLADASRRRAVDAERERFVARHFAQPDLFGTSPIALRPATPGRAFSAGVPDRVAVEAHARVALIFVPPRFTERL